jgi:hypothetical protein
MKIIIYLVIILSWAEFVFGYECRFIPAQEQFPKDSMPLTVSLGTSEDQPEGIALKLIKNAIYLWQSVEKAGIRFNLVKSGGKIVVNFAVKNNPAKAKPRGTHCRIDTNYQQVPTTHEFGHCLGLHESLDPNALMYSKIDPGKPHKLQEYDIRCITQLWPCNKDSCPETCFDDECPKRGWTQMICKDEICIEDSLGSEEVSKDGGIEAGSREDKEEKKQGPESVGCSCDIFRAQSSISWFIFIFFLVFFIRRKKWDLLLDEFRI